MVQKIYDTADPLVIDIHTTTRRAAGTHYRPNPAALQAFRDPFQVALNAAHYVHNAQTAGQVNPVQLDALLLQEPLPQRIRIAVERAAATRRFR